MFQSSEVKSKMRIFVQIGFYLSDAFLVICVISMLLVVQFLPQEQNALQIINWLTSIVTVAFFTFLPVRIKEIQSREHDKYGENHKNHVHYRLIPKEIQSSFDWLYSRADIVRTEQSFDFVLERHTYEGNPAVKISGIHRYTIKNPSATETLHIPIRLITELGWQSMDTGGFTCAIITTSSGGRTQFQGETIKRRIGYEMRSLTGTTFKHDEKIPPGQSATFEFHTYGIYRLRDRFIWYSQDFSADCKITVINQTGSSSLLWYQVYHHEREQIENGRIQQDEKMLMSDIIIFGEPIFPYEGLAMYWDFNDIANFFE